MNWLGVRASGYEKYWSTVRAAAGRRRIPAPAGGSRRPAFTVHDLRPDAPATAVALTIDDGPDPTWTPAVLDVLARHRVAATFFLVGQRVVDNPGLCRRIQAQGHAIGNHSMRHPQPFAARRADQVTAEIREAQRAITAAAGEPRLFRAPAGGWSPDVLRAAAEERLTPVDWTVDPADWQCPGTDRIVATLLTCRPGDIMLCHDGGGDRAQTAAALDVVIPCLHARGMTFVAL